MNIKIQFFGHKILASITNDENTIIWPETPGADGRLPWYENIELSPYKEECLTKAKRILRDKLNKTNNLYKLARIDNILEN